MSWVLKQVTLGARVVDWQSSDGTEGNGFSSNNMLRCKILECPHPSKLWTVKMGIEVLGWKVTTQTASSQRSANFCFPFSPTFLTNTWSPGCKEAPRNFTSYHFFLLSPDLFILARAAHMSMLYLLSKVSGVACISDFIVGLMRRKKNSYGKSWHSTKQEKIRWINVVSCFWQSPLGGMVWYDPPVSHICMVSQI